MDKSTSTRHTGGKSRIPRKTKRNNAQNNELLDLHLMYVDYGFRSEILQSHNPNPNLMSTNKMYSVRGAGGLQTEKKSTPNTVLQGTKSWSFSDDRTCPGKKVFDYVMTQDLVDTMTTIYIHPYEQNQHVPKTPFRPFKYYYEDLSAHCEINDMCKSVPTKHAIYTVTKLEYVTAICEGLQRKRGRDARVLVLALHNDVEDMPRIQQVVHTTPRCCARTLHSPIICDIGVLLASNARDLFHDTCFVTQKRRSLHSI